MTMSTPSSSLFDDIGQVVFDAETIQQTVARLGAAISADYVGLNPLLVGSLTGVVIFMADLLRHITVPVAVDFMAISHYAASEHSGTVRITKDLDLLITDRHVLFVEDVIDTGLTCDYLLRTLRTRRPASLKVCTLLSDPTCGCSRCLSTMWASPCPTSSWWAMVSTPTSTIVICPLWPPSSRAFAPSTPPLNHYCDSTASISADQAASGRHTASISARATGSGSPCRTRHR